MIEYCFFIISTKITGFSLELYIPFYGPICDNLEFPSVKSSKIVSAHRIQRGTKKVGFVKACFSIFAHRCEETGLNDFPEKRAPAKVKHLLTVCQVSRNFTQRNAKKITVRFDFCAHVHVIKYRKH